MTERAVVDTNVLVAANGRDTHVDISCQRRCEEELARILREEVVCIDDKWLILREYQTRIAHKGQPGPGTVFFKTVCQTRGDPNRVCSIPVVPLDPRDTEGRDFADPVLPRHNLKKDAKFLAVAVNADATIVNATDSDWAEHRELTDGLGVRVRQLCPQPANR